MCYKNISVYKKRRKAKKFFLLLIFLSTSVGAAKYLLDLSNRSDVDFNWAVITSVLSAASVAFGIGVGITYRNSQPLDFYSAVYRLGSYASSLTMTFDLSYCGISGAYTWMHGGDYYGMINFQKINFSHNAITGWNWSAFTPSPFSGCQIFDFSYNSISDAHGLPQMFDTTSYWPNLKKLYLDHNPNVASVSYILGKYSNLEILSIGKY